MALDYFPPRLLRPWALPEFIALLAELPIPFERKKGLLWEWGALNKIRITATEEATLGVLSEGKSIEWPDQAHPPSELSIPTSSQETQNYGHHFWKRGQTS